MTHYQSKEMIYSQIKWVGGHQILSMDRILNKLIIVRIRHQLAQKYLFQNITNHPYSKFNTPIILWKELWKSLSWKKLFRKKIKITNQFKITF